MARKFNRVERIRAVSQYEGSRSPKAKAKGAGSPARPGKSGVGHLPPMMRGSASMPSLPAAPAGGAAGAAAAGARAADGTAPDRATGPRGEAVLSKTPLAGPGLPAMDSTYGTAWVVGPATFSHRGWDPSDILNHCYVPSIGWYLRSDSNPAPLGDAPTAPEYSNGDGWYDYHNNVQGAPITVTAGDGSATGGGGGH